VVTGAMRGPTAISADGPANVIAAVKTALAKDARGKGVLVVLNDEIHSARDVRKTDSNRVDAFQSPEWGAMIAAGRQFLLSGHCTNPRCIADDRQGRR